MREQITPSKVLQLLLETRGLIDKFNCELLRQKIPAEEVAKAIELIDQAILFTKKEINENKISFRVRPDKLIRTLDTCQRLLEKLEEFCGVFFGA